ncbi:SPX domain-domain-containing protein [Absidia repens]|uniref:SPX domain-domain-containing protein n=1 Tax=Absidia repens TaxID=90262 RepID=A0A1X2IE78_9FUNG|nr:SPX domain-domain-containing protein [Absidia repens]
MKFSHSLQFNAVPDWMDKYVAYDHLKKIIFQLEKERVDAMNQKEKARQDEGEQATPTTTSHLDENVFLTQLDLQLEKVFDFYTQKESELYTLLDELEASTDVVQGDDVEYYPNNNNNNNNNHIHNLETLDSTLNVNGGTTSNDEKQPSIEIAKRRPSLESRFSLHSTTSSHVQALVDLRARLINLYVSLSELESYIDLNKSAFQKILKKHDKVLDGDLRSQYLKKMVLDSRPFMPQTIQVLQSQILRVEKLYANAFCQGDTHLALRQMKSHLRDQVTYDRNTVWREMVSQERRKLDAHVKNATQSRKKYSVGFIQLEASLIRHMCFFLLAIVVFIILLNVHIFAHQSENYCFALLIFAAIMWATEAVPLYATSLLIPFLVVLLGIMRNEDGSPMDAKTASKEVFASMFSDTIMMLLGGFALAAALSKYGIAKAFATHVLSRAGTRPRWVLLAIMFVSTFLSMWISNVATPVLCFSLIDPILRTLPDHTSVGSCLILGIALASCIGGMTSPISSPQNIITLQYMNPNPGWGIWFGAALPIAIICIFTCWSLLLLIYRPDRDVPRLNKIKPTTGKVSMTQVFVMFISIITIALWCAESSIQDAVGSTGVIAAIPLFMFFGTGVLNKDDLNAFLWSVVVLAQGGMALGNAVTSSGLLQDIALQIKDGIQDLPVIAILAVFAFLILVFSTFVSHTVAALVIIPIVQQVGQTLPTPHPNLLVMGAGLACSAGMGLPVSGYPNMTASGLEDRFGNPYLTSRDFIVTGVPTSVVCTLLIFTLGYGILSAVGY